MFGRKETASEYAQGKYMVALDKVTTLRATPENFREFAQDPEFAQARLSLALQMELWSLGAGKEATDLVKQNKQLTAKP